MRGKLWKAFNAKKQRLLPIVSEMRRWILTLHFWQRNADILLQCHTFLWCGWHWESVFIIAGILWNWWWPKRNNLVSDCPKLSGFSPENEDVDWRRGSFSFDGTVYNTSCSFCGSRLKPSSLLEFICWKPSLQQNWNARAHGSANRHQYLCRFQLMQTALLVATAWSGQFPGNTMMHTPMALEKLHQILQTMHLPWKTQTTCSQDSDSVSQGAQSWVVACCSNTPHWHCCQRHSGFH